MRVGLFGAMPTSSESSSAQTAFVVPTGSVRRLASAAGSQTRIRAESSETSTADPPGLYPRTPVEPGAMIRVMAPFPFLPHRENTGSAVPTVTSSVPSALGNTSTARIGRRAVVTPVARSCSTTSPALLAHHAALCASETVSDAHADGIEAA